MPHEPGHVLDPIQASLQALLPPQAGEVPAVPPVSDLFSYGKRRIEQQLYTLGINPDDLPKKYLSSQGDYLNFLNWLAFPPDGRPLTPKEIDLKAIALGAQINRRIQGVQREEAKSALENPAVDPKKNVIKAGERRAKAVDARARGDEASAAILEHEADMLSRGTYMETPEDISKYERLVSARDAAAPPKPPALSPLEAGRSKGLARIEEERTFREAYPKDPPKARDQIDVELDRGLKRVELLRRSERLKREMGSAFEGNRPDPSREQVQSSRRATALLERMRAIRRGLGR